MNAYTNYTETDLFALIAQGDETAFRHIFHQYNKKLFPFVCTLVKVPADAKEVIQTVFIKLWMNRSKLESVQNPGAWLHTLTTNATYDFLRSKARYELRLNELGKIQDVHVHEIVDTEKIETTRAQDLIMEAMQQMPQRRRQVFQLIKIEGYDRKEAAQILNISENTVRNQLAEAMRFVEEFLKNRAIILVVPLSVLLATVS